ncbi:centrosomal protein of 76 kDa isoform X2 [Brachyistius frenatus]|uniref:centrosomal protein of 76 kDa isoform X2 n=1 Tax=Brachyistius frenatus TaxID=100188 RepID=UPI0037E71140
MSLPPEKASELKLLIHNHLLKMDIHGRIREVLAETGRDNPGSTRSLSETDFLLALQRRGVIDDVMKHLQFTQEPEPEPPPEPATGVVDKSVPELKTNTDPSRRYLYLQVLGGKAFLEHLQEPEPLPGQVRSTFTLYLHFRNQRFRSKPVPCACEPDLKEGFLLEIHREGTGGSSKMADVSAMLSMCDPVHLVLIKTDTSGETALVSSYFLDWRNVLSSPSGKTCSAVELMGVGSECKLPAGVLTVSVELYPPPPETLSSDIISTQRSLERQRTAEKERLFLVYAKQWWREFLEIRPSHQSKLVKIFAQDENAINRPVCSYVRVLRAGRLLESPRQAARLVSLLAHEKAAVVGGGGRQEQWCTLMAFLCRGKNPSQWKAMSEEALKSVCAPGSTTSLPPLPPLCAPSLDPAAASNQLELEMRYLVSEHRKDLDLATVWDDHLSYLLSSALSAYELERCTGVSCGNEEFQDAVRRAVPDGHTFKGFPIHFLHRNARRAFATCLRSPFCEEIVCCRGDHVRLAVRVRVFVYPENACAVWLMFACKYRCVL